MARLSAQMLAAMTEEAIKRLPDAARRAASGGCWMDKFEDGHGAGFAIFAVPLHAADPIATALQEAGGKRPWKEKQEVVSVVLPDPERN